MDEVDNYTCNNGWMIIIVDEDNIHVIMDEDNYTCNNGWR